MCHNGHQLFAIYYHFSTLVAIGKKLILCPDFVHYVVSKYAVLLSYTRWLSRQMRCIYYYLWCFGHMWSLCYHVWFSLSSRYLAMWIWSCKDKLKVKIAHFQLPSAAQKCVCLFLIVCGSVSLMSQEGNWVSQPSKRFRSKLFMKKPSWWSNQTGKIIITIIILTAGQFARLPALNRTPDVVDWSNCIVFVPLYMCMWYFSY